MSSPSPVPQGGVQVPPLELPPAAPEASGRESARSAGPEPTSAESKGGGALVDAKKVIKHYIHTAGGSTLHLPPTAFLVAHEYPTGRIVIVNWDVAGVPPPHSDALEKLAAEDDVLGCQECKFVEKVEAWEGFPPSLRKILIHLFASTDECAGMSSAQIGAYICANFI